MDKKKLAKWAAEEIKLAKKKHLDSSGYIGCSNEVYDAAVTAYDEFVKLSNDDYSYRVPYGILGTLIDSLPLSIIEGIDDKEWKSHSVTADGTVYRNRRCKSLYKTVHFGGEITYTDSDRIDIIYTKHELMDSKKEVVTNFKPAKNLVDKLYPVKIPYYPCTYKVFVDASLIFQNKFKVQGIVNNHGELINEHNGIYEIDANSNPTLISKDIDIKKICIIPEYHDMKLDVNTIVDEFEQDGHIVIVADDNENSNYARIDMCDELYIVNRGNSISDITINNYIYYAIAQNKPVTTSVKLDEKEKDGTSNEQN